MNTLYYDHMNTIEQLLMKSRMDDYDMYTKEDLLDFAMIIVKDCSRYVSQCNLVGINREKIPTDIIEYYTTNHIV